MANCSACKQIVAALTTKSSAVTTWEQTTASGGTCHRTCQAGRVTLGATLTLQPGETVSLYTAFADNALAGPDTGAAPGVTKAATAAATTASDGANAGTIAEERASWWGTYWAQSSISLPSRPLVEKFRFGAQYIVGSMASTNPLVRSNGLPIVYTCLAIDRPLSPVAGPAERSLRSVLQMAIYSRFRLNVTVFRGILDILSSFSIESSEKIWHLYCNSQYTSIKKKICRLKSADLDLCDRALGQQRQPFLERRLYSRLSAL